MFAGNTILYLENPTDATPELLELINEFSKVSGYKKKERKKERNRWGRLRGTNFYLQNKWVMGIKCTSWGISQ